jgi:putative acetyltransferase
MVSSGPSRSAVTIERALSATADVRALIGALDAELAQHYAPEQRHGLALDAIFQPHIRFFIARHDGEALGCGGVALFADFAEIKRMYVRENARGQGIADAIVAQLSAEAAAAGLSLLQLETGTQQAAAMRFYRRCGFSPCAAFEPYASMPPAAIATSYFMEKQIGATRA